MISLCCIYIFTCIYTLFSSLCEHNVFVVRGFPVELLKGNIGLVQKVHESGHLLRGSHVYIS